MTKIGLYITGFLALSAVLWGAVETIKQRGRDEVRAAVAEQSAATIKAAADRAAETTAAMQRRAEEDEAALAEVDLELKELRNAHLTANGVDPVVFGDEWADWVRGKSGRPGK